MIQTNLSKTLNNQHQIGLKKREAARYNDSGWHRLHGAEFNAAAPSAIRQRGKTPHGRRGLVKTSLVLKDVHKRRPCFVRAGRHLPGNGEQNANASFRRSDHRSVKIKPTIVFVDKTATEVWFSSKLSLLICTGISTKVPWQGPTLLSLKNNLVLWVCDDDLPHVEVGREAHNGAPEKQGH